MLRLLQDGFDGRKFFQICKLDSASFILPIFRLKFTCFCVPNFQDLFVFRLVPKFSTWLFQTEWVAFEAALSARAFDATTHLKKPPGIVYK